MHIFVAIVLSLLTGFALGVAYGDKLKADEKSEEARIKALENKIRAKL